MGRSEELGWVYNLRNDEWVELTRMSHERDECEGVVFGWWFFLSCCGLVVVLVVVVCAVLCWCFFFFFFGGCFYYYFIELFVLF